MSDPTTLTDTASNLGEQLRQLAMRADELAQQTATLISSQNHDGGPFFVQGLTVLVLAMFVGYYVVWRVTPALHSPLMAVTNAISSVIIVGALIASGPDHFGFSSFMGFLAVLLAAVNIFGGFIVTQRMLHMYKKKGK
jgi:NAD(P) transhydrogenase subunit alpha